MEHDLSEKLGIRIRKFRTQAGLTQAQLADLCGKSPEAISNLERGKATPSVATLQLLADRLGASLHEMFDFGKVPKNNANAGLSGKIELLTKGDQRLVGDFVDMLHDRRGKR